ncbi:MAG: DNA repair protein RecN [Muribaculaceae bacterium]|nr:DNA repair protein RecN [Muribaculaceae bacterium]
MLQELHVSNYALIDRIDVTFHPGLNIITGETGAGKSILLGALSLILGARADSRTVKRAENKSVIECVFDPAGIPGIQPLIESFDIDWDSEQCILRREISPGGRSRAFINDTPVSLAQLKEVALLLVDVHSQHQNQLLADPRFQLSIIDAIASNGDRLEQYAVLYTRYRQALRKLKAAKTAIQHTSENAELIEYQLSKLEEFGPRAGEQEELERERDNQANATELKTALDRALSALTSGHSNILSLLTDVDEAVTDMDQLIPAEENIAARIEQARIELTDIAETLAGIDERLGADPEELERIELRLDELYDLQKRHKVSSEDELIALRDKLRADLERLESGPAAISELENAARKARAAARAAADEITEARREAASRFAAMLSERAIPLGMKNLQCEIKIEPTDMSLTGTDRVEFLFAFNKNQPLIPVQGAASGGEISRLMLCIKAIVADKMQLPSIVFDEVDTGVSGEVAARMGAMMQDMSRNIQVIVITHLPQVAAKGAHHFKVYKEDDESATHTRISELSTEQRIEELSIMLGGDLASETTRAAARTLLGLNND